MSLDAARSFGTAWMRSMRFVVTPTGLTVVGLTLAYTYARFGRLPLSGRAFGEALLFESVVAFFVLAARRRFSRAVVSAPGWTLLRVLAWTFSPRVVVGVFQPTINDMQSEYLDALLAAAVILTVVAGENLTVGSTVWLPAESVAPGR